MFEVDHSHEPRRIVNLKQKSCGCGRWQLNGIPCLHACASIYANKEVPERYISEWYLVKTYLKSYAPDISPMPGPNDWPVDKDTEPIEPPISKKQKGRPKKLRRRGIDENDPLEIVKVTRQGYDVTCGNCGKKGHNARGCKQPENPNRRKWVKRVRNKKQNHTAATNVSFWRKTNIFDCMIDSLLIFLLNL